MSLGRLEVEEEAGDEDRGYSVSRIQTVVNLRRVCRTYDLRLREVDKVLCGQQDGVVLLSAIQWFSLGYDRYRYLPRA